MAKKDRVEYKIGSLKPGPLARLDVVGDKTAIVATYNIERDDGRGCWKVSEISRRAYDNPRAPGVRAELGACFRTKDVRQLISRRFTKLPRL